MRKEAKGCGGEKRPAGVWRVAESLRDDTGERRWTGYSGRLNTLAAVVWPEAS